MSSKKIHIEKYDISTFKKQGKPYVMILTDVIQRVPSDKLNAAFLWIYLETLPATWKPTKSHLTKHFNISDRTYERWVSWLNLTGLIEYRQIRYTDGTYGKGELVVLDGTEFNPDAVSDRTAKFVGVDEISNKVVQLVQPNRIAKLPRCGEMAAHIINTTIKEEKIQTTTTTPQNPVVVENSQTPLPPTPPDTLSDSERKRLTDAYNTNPVATKHINCLDLFLQAALFSILNREDGVSRPGRVKGIIGFVNSGNFEEHPLWAKDQKPLLKVESKEEARARFIGYLEFDMAQDLEKFGYYRDSTLRKMKEMNYESMTKAS